MRQLAGKAGVRFGRIGLFLAALTLATATNFVPASWMTAEAQVSTAFSRIDVAGNQRIEANTVRAIAGISAGQRVSPAQLNDSMQALFASGLFEDVEFVPQAGRLIIQVVENPTINIINFEGNKALSDDALASIIALEPRRAFNSSAAEADALRIVEAYRAQGQYNASVRPVIIRRTDNRVDLVYEIAEGRTTDISRISFVGNKRFSDSRLRRSLETSETGLFSFLSSTDTYDRDRVTLDRELLRQFYLDRGHVDFNIRSVVSELSADRSGFFVSYNIFEGPVYDFGDVSVSSSVPEVDADDYQRDVSARTGQTFDASEIEKIVERIVFNMNKNGHVFVDVAPRVTKNQESRTMDIEFEIVRTPKVFVERIDIEGNNRTLDRVIRRQFRIVEGDPINQREIRRAENRIRGLGLFSRIAVRVREGSSSDQAIIDVDVEEERTGSLSFGVGYSNDGGFNGTVSFAERNLFGRGQSVSAQISIAEDSRIVAFSFREPSVLDRDVGAEFDLYFREFDRDESSFQETNLGFEPSVDFPVSEDARLSVRYRLSSDEIRDVDANASALILPRKDITSSLAFSYTLDKRNSPVDPSGGYQLRIEQEFAGLGGDISYSKTVGKAKVFTSFFNEDLILSAELEGGTLIADGESRITDRFFLGGDSLRGFATGGVGPRDVCTGCGGAGGDVNDALGGNIYAVGRLEASFPLGLPEELGIFGGVFFDVGSVWSLDNTAGSSGAVDDGRNIRSAAGVSLFWSTPIGPLRFNFARAIEKESYDETENFRVSIDTRF